MKFLGYLVALVLSCHFSSSAFASVIVKVPVYIVYTYENVHGTTGQDSPPVARLVALSVSKEDSSNATEIRWASVNGYGVGSVKVYSDGDFEISYDRSAHSFLWTGKLKGVLQGNTIAIKSYEEYDINYISLTKEIVRSSAPSEFVQLPLN